MVSEARRACERTKLPWERARGAVQRVQDPRGSRARPCVRARMTRKSTHFAKAARARDATRARVTFDGADSGAPGPRAATCAIHRGESSLRRPRGRRFRPSRLRRQGGSIQSQGLATCRVEEGRADAGGAARTAPRRDQEARLRAHGAARRLRAARGVREALLRDGRLRTFRASSRVKRRQFRCLLRRQ